MKQVILSKVYASPMFDVSSIDPTNKHYGFKEGGKKGFIFYSSESYCFMCVTKGLGIHVTTLHSSSDSYAGFFAKLINENFEIFEFDKLSELAEWIES